MADPIETTAAASPDPRKPNKRDERRAAKDAAKLIADAKKQAAQEGAKEAYALLVEERNQQNLASTIQRDSQMAETLNSFTKYIDFWMPDISLIERAQKIYDKKWAEVPVGESMEEMPMPFSASTRVLDSNEVYKAFIGTENFRNFVRTFDQRESVGDFLLTVERIAFHMRNIDQARMATEQDRRQYPEIAVGQNYVMKPYMHHATELMDFARGTLLEVLESDKVDPMLKAFCKDTFEMTLQRSFEVMKRAEASPSKLKRFVNNARMTGKIPQPLARKVEDFDYQIVQKKYRVFNIELDGDEIYDDRKPNVGAKAFEYIKKASSAGMKRGIEAESFIEEAILTGHLRRNMKDISIKDKIISRLRIAKLQMSGVTARPSIARARLTDRKNLIPTIENINTYVRKENILPWFYGTANQINGWWNSYRAELFDKVFEGTRLSKGFSRDTIVDVSKMFNQALNDMNLDMFNNPNLFGAGAQQLDEDRVALFFLENALQSHLKEDGVSYVDGFTDEHKDLMNFLKELIEYEIIAKAIDAASTAILIKPTKRTPSTPAVLAPAPTESVLPITEEVEVVHFEDTTEIIEIVETVSIIADSVSDDVVEPATELSSLDDVDFESLDLKAILAGIRDKPAGNDDVRPKETNSSAKEVDTTIFHLPSGAAAEIGATPEATTPKATSRATAENRSNGFVEKRTAEILNHFDSKLSSIVDLKPAIGVVRKELKNVLSTASPLYFIEHDLMNREGVDLEKASAHFMDEVENCILDKPEHEVGVDLVEILRVTSAATKSVSDGNNGLNI